MFFMLRMWICITISQEEHTVPLFLQVKTVDDRPVNTIKIVNMEVK